MGMFDTFITTWRGKQVDVQLKDFGCDLSNFMLGDVVDSSQRGVGIFMLDFSVDLDLLHPAFSTSSFDGNRFILGILKDGVWIDYAVYPTLASAEAMVPHWVAFYSNPAAASFAWQSLHAISRQRRHHIDRNTSDLRKYVHEFNERDKPRKKPFGLSLHRIWKTPPRRSLTFKNLLSKIQLFFKSTSSENLPTEYEAWRSHTFYESGGYFYDGPTYPQPEHFPLESGSLSDDAHEKTLLHHLHAFDFKFFQQIYKQDTSWFSKTSPSFQSALRLFLKDLTHTRLLSFGWLWMRESMGQSVPLEQDEQMVSHPGFRDISLWLHFLNVLGVDESWAIRADETIPNLTDSCSEVAVGLTVPPHYSTLSKKFSLSDSEYANALLDNVPVFHRVFFGLLLDYDERRERLTLYKRWVESGVNPYLVDPHGNSAIMAFFQHLNQLASDKLSQHAWLFDVNHQRFGHIGEETSTLFQQLLIYHPMELRNHRGESMLDLFPQNFHIPYELEQRVQHRLLTAQHPASQKNVTHNKRTAL